MFIQIHMLQSMPPGNLNRDDTGKPKKCIFGGVTRARISSQCLKRNIRRSEAFEEAFKGNLADRTTYMPRMVADQLKTFESNFAEAELIKIKEALAKKFKADKSSKDDSSDTDSPSTSDETDKTGQLVFFPQAFAQSIAELINTLKMTDKGSYDIWLGEKTKDKDRSKEASKKIKQLEEDITAKSKAITVDIGLFGRMTTSDLVVNVEASCQVAHAISTHETLIESDYFTAMDDLKSNFASTQTEAMGAAFLGSGETETFFNSAVYYKYFNLDLDALKEHLGASNPQADAAVGVLIEAAARFNPTGKQNSFAAHGVPSLILVEVSQKKQPISYANAFLKPVTGQDLLEESVNALRSYISNVATAYAPTDLSRVLLIDPTKGELENATIVNTLDELVSKVTSIIQNKKTEVPA